MEFACLSFLHSDWHDGLHSDRSEERLKQPEWLEQFLERWGLRVEQPFDEEIYRELVALRALLQRLVRRLDAGEALPDEDLEALNSYLAAVPLRRSLARGGGEYHLRLQPEERNWRWVRAELAASFADLLAHHDPARVKICDNPDCQWVYYDESRNQTRRWCDDECANVMRVRRFRQRKREQQRAEA